MPRHGEGFVFVFVLLDFTGLEELGELFLAVFYDGSSEIKNYDGCEFCTTVACGSWKTFLGGRVIFCLAAFGGFRLFLVRFCSLRWVKSGLFYGMAGLQILFCAWLAVTAFQGCWSAFSLCGYSAFQSLAWFACLCVVFYAARGYRVLSILLVQGSTTL